MKKLNPQFLFVYLLAFLPLGAWACSCMYFDDPQQSYADADVVVVARVVSNTEMQYKLEVLQSWKAEVPTSINVLSREDTSCGYDFTKGVHLLFISRNKEGKFRTDLCSGNFHESSIYYSKSIEWLNKHGKKNKR